MGAGRKTQTLVVNTKATSPKLPTSGHVTARNLPKRNLGGVIFGCTNKTMQECLAKQLFGLPAAHFLYVQKIDQGLPLFLFNYSNRKLHGIFEAASPGRMNINPYAWTTDGSERTLYPAQVQIRVKLQCQPLIEDQFKPIIIDNYFKPNHFWFELDHAQANKVISLLAESVVLAPRSFVPENNARRSIIRPLPSTDTKEENEGSKPLALVVEPAKKPSWVSDLSDADHSEDGGKDADELFKLLALEAENFSNFSQESDSTESASLDGHNQQLEAHLDKKAVAQEEERLVLEKLRKLVALNNENQDLSSTDDVGKPAVIDDTHLDNDKPISEQVNVTVEKLVALNNENQDLSSTDDVGKPAVIDDTHLDNDKPISEQVNVTVENEYSCSSSHCQSIIAELVREMEELKTFKTEQTLKMSYLELKLVQVQNEIQWLKDHCEMVETPSSSSTIDSKVIHPLDELQLDPTESIYLVGGYNGESWLSMLESYFPSCDEVKSLKPMNSVRSYASIAQLNGKLYVFGGGDGTQWYDTVEAYDPVDDEWTFCPRMNGKKGSLAGAAMNDKLFVIGGGNSVDCFSDVEMLDFDIGKWIQTRSMLQKRFAVAAVQHNGVLYATGGYDGNEYLNTAERFDPREHSWTRIASMNKRRACHSLAVLNEKIYALGGFDGEAMVPSVEVYDPRLGAWMRGEPMKQSRGYSAAAVVKDSIYVIGGVREGDDVVDTVECYKEGQGWEETISEAIGRRCFMSAIAVSCQLESDNH